MIVKVCGITNAEDALAAVAAGANALGFNFYPRSPRYVTPDAAAEIIAHVPASVWKVGVFVNESAEFVESVCRRAGVDIAQLHGEETADSYPRGLRTWKAFRVNADFSMSALDALPVEALLLDGPAEILYGGSGKTFDWSVAARPLRKIVIAGGLDASNVARAIEAAHPWGVDACSGLESSPGRKDHFKMSQFIKAALAA